MKMREVETNINKSQIENESDSNTADLLELLFKNGSVEKIGEGAHGVVFKIDFSALTEEQILSLQEEYPEIGQKNNAEAIKLLKIFSRASAEDEMRNQNLANKILENEYSPVKGRVTSPKAHKIHEITMQNKEVVEELIHVHNVKIDPLNPHICLIMMDFVDGETLEDIESRAFLKKNANKLKELCPNVDPEETYGNTLRNITQKIIGGMQSDQFKDHCETLGKKLEGSMLFSEEMVRDLDTALSLFHKKGLYHRDLHLGNIMIGKDGKIYIIDFDQSVTIDPQDEEEVSQIYKVALDYDKGIKRSKLPDSWVIEHLKAIARTPEQGKTLRKETIVKGIMGNILSRKNSLWPKFYEKLDDKNIPIEQIVTAFANRFAKSGIGTERAEYEVTALIALSESGRQDETVKYAEARLDQEISAKEHNLFANFLEYIS